MIVNVALKMLLMSSYAQVGLAFATSVGAWINLLLLAWFSARQNFLVIDARLRRSIVKIAIAGAVLAAGLAALPMAGPGACSRTGPRSATRCCC